MYVCMHVQYHTHTYVDTHTEINDSYWYMNLMITMEARVMQVVHAYVYIQM